MAESASTSTARTIRIAPAISLPLPGVRRRRQVPLRARDRPGPNGPNPDRPTACWGTRFGSSVRPELPVRDQLAGRGELSSRSGPSPPLLDSSAMLPARPSPAPGGAPCQPPSPGASGGTRSAWVPGRRTAPGVSPTPKPATPHRWGRALGVAAIGQCAHPCDRDGVAAAERCAPSKGLQPPGSAVCPAIRQPRWSAAGLGSVLGALLVLRQVQRQHAGQNQQVVLAGG